jgi:hypothetical protein
MSVSRNKLDEPELARVFAAAHASAVASAHSFSRNSDSAKVNAWQHRWRFVPTRNFAVAISDVIGGKPDMRKMWQDRVIDPSLPFCGMTFRDAQHGCRQRKT